MYIHKTSNGFNVVLNEICTKKGKLANDISSLRNKYLKNLGTK